MIKNNLNQILDTESKIISKKQLLELEQIKSFHREIPFIIKYSKTKLDEYNVWFTGFQLLSNENDNNDNITLLKRCIESYKTSQKIPDINFSYILGVNVVVPILKTSTKEEAFELAHKVIENYLSYQKTYFEIHQKKEKTRKFII